MCRNIRTLYNFAPPANGDEVHAAALQYVPELTWILFLRILDEQQKRIGQFPRLRDLQR